MKVVAEKNASRSGGVSRKGGRMGKNTLAVGGQCDDSFDQRDQIGHAPQMCCADKDRRIGE
jgi:hypothetical protein